MLRNVIEWNTPGSRLIPGRIPFYFRGPPHKHKITITENEIVRGPPKQVTMEQHCPANGVNNCTVKYEISETFTNSCTVSVGGDLTMIPLRISVEYGFSMTASVSEAHEFNLKPGTCGKIVVQPLFHQVKGTYAGSSNNWTEIEFTARLPKTMLGSSSKADGEVYFDQKCLECQHPDCPKTFILKIR